jgi:hypothetical protein
MVECFSRETRRFQALRDNWIKLQHCTAPPVAAVRECAGTPSSRSCATWSSMRLNSGLTTSVTRGG